jgi:hypothetical protein
MATRFAFETYMAQLARATAGDCRKHLTVAKRNVGTELIEVTRRVLPETVSDRWPRARLGTCKDLFDLPPRTLFGRVGQVQVDHGRLKAAVSEVLLNHFE